MAKALNAQTMSTVHSNVRAEMARQRISQTDVASILGLNQAAVSRRLSGKIEFTASELSKLADSLTVPVSTFFGERVAS